VKTEIILVCAKNRTSVTEKVGSSGNTSDLNSGSARFERFVMVKITNGADQTDPESACEAFGIHVFRPGRSEEIGFCRAH
jgi:hypothetical protein